ncbi:MAG: MBL fold metallo-hydrolase [Pseudomonas sp.]|uniref:MBL fold metallo-hydrolase n=1 Tax=Pseudomonas sp. TaxID=306 RepID=UPI00271AF752|nr:MBL fold metallo-hydrolase [Pseudomonas sp.]MDO9331065.1 MBL fold metallo-hydrolase [Pseudomonas sp.]
MPALIEAFLDPASSTYSYVIHEGAGSQCAIVDPVLDYDPAAGRTATTQADKIIAFVRKHQLQVQWLLETHAHADHLSAAPYLKDKLGGKLAIGRRIFDVQAVFKRIFNAKDMNTDGSEFDHLLDDGELLKIGELEVSVMYTPGHTPACLTFVMGREAFIGDTLFMPDYGSARCDFPGGDAQTLFHSIKKILALAPDTRLHLCHDYPPEGRGPMWRTTVMEQREKNIHVHDGVTEAEFVSMRTARDKTLAMPTLLLPAIQVNVRAGRLPPPEDNGVSYLKIPVNAL